MTTDKVSDLTDKITAKQALSEFDIKYIQSQQQSMAEMDSLIEWVTLLETALQSEALLEEVQPRISQLTQLALENGYEQHEIELILNPVKPKI